MLDAFLRGDYAAAPTPLSIFALSLLLALLLGQAVAWVYMVTHNGLSYSRAFVVSLALWAHLSFLHKSRPTAPTGRDLIARGSAPGKRV